VINVRPPSEWAGAQDLGGQVYWSRDPDEPVDSLVSLLIWHWCPLTAGGRWLAQGVLSHTLVSLDPLHLEPSLMWMCCGKHGFIREGRWQPV
jgi:hypothetical protein